MIADELDQFIDAFATYFPEVSVWLDKQTDATVKAWRDSLERLRFDAAMDALRGFHCGDLKPPASWSLWPAEIAKQSRHQTATTVRPVRYIDGEPTVFCRKCKDTGIVCCWHPVSMRAMSNTIRELENEKHFGDRGTLYTVAVRCDCEEGSTRYPSYKQIFNERQWVPCDGLHDKASIEALENFIRLKRNMRNHPSYTDFGEYGAN